MLERVPRIHSHLGSLASYSNPMNMVFYHSSSIASKGKSEKIPYSRTGCILVWTVLSGDGVLNSVKLMKVL